jgi:hypothetical protein
MCGLIFGLIYSWAQAETTGYYENLSKNNPDLIKAIVRNIRE